MKPTRSDQVMQVDPNEYHWFPHKRDPPRASYLLLSCETHQAGKICELENGFSPNPESTE